MEGASAPITTLSRLAFKDALLELQVTARKTREASFEVLQRLFQSAERRLGVEVEIEDPAIRSLFQVHVLAVEELLQQARKR